MNKQLWFVIGITALLTAALSWGAQYFFLEKTDSYWSQMKKNQHENQQVLERLIKSDRIHSQLNSSTPTDFIQASRLSTPAVVFIECIQDGQDLMPIVNKGVSSGSGVIISPDGFIVTNNHVIEKAKSIQIMLNDNHEYQAKLIGTDPNTDLALLKIEANGLPYLIFGNSDSAQVGEWVLAVGNPFRLQSTVTAGIISAKARNINILNNQQYRIESFIQTDAAVNSGNSGGALVNSAGELIGINTAIMTYTGRYEGYSFSIPSNLVRKVIFDIQEFGTVQRGLLGVTIENVDNQRARQFGLEKISGVYISNITKDGAADEAGLKPDDIILEVNQRVVNSVSELQEIIGRFRPGSEVSLSYWRNGIRYQTKAILKNQINSTELISTRRDPILIEYGFEVRDLSDKEVEKIKTRGVRVLSIYRESKVWETNMVPNYIITHVNGKKITTVDELISQMEAARDKISLDGFYEEYRGRYPYSFYKP